MILDKKKDDRERETLQHQERRRRKTKIANTTPREKSSCPVVGKR